LPAQRAKRGMSSHPMDLGIYAKSSSCEGSFSALMPFVGAAIQSKYSTSTVPAGFLVNLCWSQAHRRCWAREMDQLNTDQEEWVMKCGVDSSWVWFRPIIRSRCHIVLPRCFDTVGWWQEGRTRTHAGPKGFLGRPFRALVSPRMIYRKNRPVIYQELSTIRSYSVPWFWFWLKK